MEWLCLTVCVYVYKVTQRLYKKQHDRNRTRTDDGARGDDAQM